MYNTSHGQDSYFICFMADAITSCLPEKIVFDPNITKEK